MNKCLFDALLICHQSIVFKIPRLQCLNQESHMMEFLLLSLKSDKTGMQLISNEEKLLRRQTHGVFYCVKE